MFASCPGHRNFSHVFNLQMPTLYARVLANGAMSTLLQHFLANSNVSRFFAEILLSFLVAKMADFGTADEAQVYIYLGVHMYIYIYIYIYIYVYI